MTTGAVDAPRDRLRLLLVEDNSNDAELILRAINSAGFEPTCLRVQTAADCQGH